MNIVGYRSPFKKKASPMKVLPAAAPAAASLLSNPAIQQGLIAAAPGIISAVGSLFGRKKRRREQRAAQEDMRQARAAFEGIEYVNPYANLENPYAENVYEDMTVNTQAADYLRQQQQQSQANIMQNLRGVAGSSGIAGLAQSLSKIATGQAQQASAQIAQQEQANKKLAAQGAELKQKGQFGVDKLKAYGEAMRRQQEDARTRALYGLSIDRTTAADTARQTARSAGIAGLGAAGAGVAGLYAPGGALYNTGNPFSNTTTPTGQGFDFDTSGYTDALPNTTTTPFGGGLNNNTTTPFGGGLGVDNPIGDNNLPSFRYDPITGTYRQFKN